MSLTYRLLDPSEWERLTTLLDSKYIPHPDAASAAVAEDHEGNLVGVLFLQIALHEEPLILRSPKVSFEQLHKVLYNAVKDNKGLNIYCFSDKEIIDRMAAHVGMKQMPYKVFVQEVV